MDIEQIKSFCVVAKYKSFRKASEILLVSQPGITRRIKSLENELNVALIDRSTHFISLTEYGKAFLPYADRLIKIMEEGKQTLLNKEIDNELRIAASTTTSLYMLPEIISLFQSKFDSQITVHVAPTHETIEMLLDQTIDFGFTTDVHKNPTLLYEKVYEEDIVCVGEPHFLENYIENGNFSRLPLPVVYNYNLISPIYRLISKYLEDTPYFDVRIRANDTSFVKKVVLQGGGLAFIPYSDVADELETNKVKQITLPDFELPKRPLYLLTIKDHPKAEINRRFKDVLDIYFERKTPSN